MSVATIPDFSYNIIPRALLDQPVPLPKYTLVIALLLYLHKLVLEQAKYQHRDCVKRRNPIIPLSTRKSNTAMHWVPN